MDGSSRNFFGASPFTVLIMFKLGIGYFDLIFDVFQIVEWYNLRHIAFAYLLFVSGIAVLVGELIVNIVFTAISKEIRIAGTILAILHLERLNEGIKSIQNGCETIGLKKAVIIELFVESILFSIGKLGTILQIDSEFNVFNLFSLAVSLVVAR